MPGSFSAGLSGLNANATYLSVIGNNLANINTIGFKSSAVTFQDGIQLPARSVLIAAGTQPNTVLAREEGVGLELDGKYFLATDETGAPVKPERHTAKPKSPQVLLHRYPDGRFISFFGDLHPSYFGNVVKAMGSAKQGYPIVSKVLASRDAALRVDDAKFMAKLNRDLRAVVHEVRRLTPTIVEVVLRAPVAARREYSQRPSRPAAARLASGSGPPGSSRPSSRARSSAGTG